jgi:hypothetical protein
MANKFEILIHLAKGFVESDTSHGEHAGGVEEQERCALDHYGSFIKEVGEDTPKRDLEALWRLSRKAKGIGIRKTKK